MKNNYSSIKLINEIITLCKDHKFSIRIVGSETIKDTGYKYPIYKIVINPKNKINFCLIAGVHGDEIAGPMTILAMLKEPTKYFSKNIRYEIYPLLNPTGYDLQQRNNNDNHDLNCINKITLKSDNYTEIQALTNSIKNRKYDALISLHEDLTQDKFYAYVFEEEVHPLYRKIISNTSKKVEILKLNKIYGANSDGNGLVINYHDYSIEDRLYHQKQAKISLSTETPGKLPLNKRILINLSNLKTINKYLLLHYSKAIY